MITILIPENNIEERKYATSILFNEFLGLKYELKTYQGDEYKIVLSNNSSIIFEDHFFSNYPEDLSYLNIDNIPQQVIFAKNEFIPEEDIPVIFGTNKMKVDDMTIKCGIDIIASSFFMFTRWEENVNKFRDKHNRFPACESLAYKNGFLNRPVVNEYVEMLWNMMISLDPGLTRKNRDFNLMLTHDVDAPFKYYGIKGGTKDLVDDIFKKKNLMLFYKHLLNKIKTHLRLTDDPYYTFDYFMNLSEEINSRSYFFFMVHGKSRFDAKYSLNSKRLKKVLESIKKRGHNLGIHPSYNAFNDKDLFAREKKILEKNIGKVEYGREHFLRFEIPTTWQIWHDNEMKWDSTLGYADKNGFRCGVCYEYSAFNILTRKKMRLKEKPLIVMDTTYLMHDSMDENRIEQDFRSLTAKVKKYNGELVVLWHNSNIEYPVVWNTFERVLRDLF